MATHRRYGTLKRAGLPPYRVRMGFANGDQLHVGASGDLCALRWLGQDTTLGYSVYVLGISICTIQTAAGLYTPSWSGRTLTNLCRRIGKDFSSPAVARFSSGAFSELLLVMIAFAERLSIRAVEVL